MNETPTLLILDESVIVYILGCMDVTTRMRCRLMNKAFAKMGIQSWMWERDVMHIMNDIQKLCEDVRHNSSSTPGFHHMKFATRERFSYLTQTAMSMGKYVANKQQLMNYMEDVYGNFQFYALLNATRRTLYDLMTMFDNLITTGVGDGECNLDILELTLMRYLQEMSTLYPINGHIDTMTNDLSAWKNVFGESVMVPYKLFCDNMVLTMDPTLRNNTKFMDHLQFHINFPSNNIMTIWRYNNLIAQYGPWNKFVENFTNIAMSDGFVGYVNIFKAEELITGMEEAKTKSVMLLRYSRLCPTLFTITEYNAAKKRVTHYRNVNRAKEIVPVNEFIDEHKAKGVVMVPLKIDDAIVHTLTQIRFDAMMVSPASSMWGSFGPTMIAINDALREGRLVFGDQTDTLQPAPLHDDIPPVIPPTVVSSPVIQMITSVGPTPVPVPTTPPTTDASTAPPPMKMAAI